MAEHIFFPSISSSSFDTYLVYCIIGLLILMAFIGLCVLLATSCCCCYCCLTSISSCYPSRRHLSYKLHDKKSKNSEQFKTDHSKRLTFIRRQSSDMADFSQLYDSCPHLINSKAMINKSTNMDASCTTINTMVTPASPCSSFRSVAQSGTLNKDNKPTFVQNDFSNPSSSPSPSVQDNTVVDQLNIVPVATIKNTRTRPFSYIKNINDRAQILRRFTQREHSKPLTSSVPIQISKISSSQNDINYQTNLNSTNIYETVLPTTNSNQINTHRTSTTDVPVPIYESEWTHNIRQLMLATSPVENRSVSVIELPSVPPDLLPTTKPSIDYFQQHNPYDKFLANRTTTSDSMRRANMLKQLNNDAAFLY